MTVHPYNPDDDSDLGQHPQDDVNPGTDPEPDQAVDSDDVEPDDDEDGGDG